MKIFFWCVVIAVGVLAAFVLVDVIIAHPWVLFGDSAGVAFAVLCVVNIPWILKSKVSVFLKAIVYFAWSRGVLTSETPVVQYGFRLLGILLICTIAFLLVWLADYLFSVPLKVIAGTDQWAFPSHAWSWGSCSAAVAAWLIAHIVPTLRAPVKR